MYGNRRIHSYPDTNCAGGSVESCSLDLIFDQEVEFTVLGPTSVHLSGYYMPTMVEEEDEEDEDDMDYDDEVEFG